MNCKTFPFKLMFLYFLCYKISRIQVTSRANENHQAGAFCDFNCNIKSDETVFGNGEALYFQLVAEILL